MLNKKIIVGAVLGLSLVGNVALLHDKHVAEKALAEYKVSQTNQYYTKPYEQPVMVKRGFHAVTPDGKQIYVNKHNTLYVTDQYATPLSYEFSGFVKQTDGTPVATQAVFYSHE